MRTELHGISAEVVKHDSKQILRLQAMGTLIHEDYEALAPDLEQAMEQIDSDEVLALVDATKLQGWTPKAIWDDFNLGLAYGRKFERVAVVSDKRWQQWATRAADWFITGKVRDFSDESTALEWLVNPDVQAPGLQVTLDQDKGIAILEPRGQLTKEDFEEAARVIDGYVEERGELTGIMIQTPRFPGWDSFSGLLEHFRFVRDHHHHVKRVALVTDSSIALMAERLSRHFIAAELEVFPYDDGELASIWLTRPWDQ